jgi:hypothetical protein
LASCRRSTQLAQRGSTIPALSFDRIWMNILDDASRPAYERESRHCWWSDVPSKSNHRMSSLGWKFKIYTGQHHQNHWTSYRYLLIQKEHLEIKSAITSFKYDIDNSPGTFPTICENIVVNCPRWRCRMASIYKMEYLLKHYLTLTSDNVDGVW